MRNFILISLFAIGTVIGGVFHYKKNKDDVVLKNAERVIQDKTVTDRIVDKKISAIVAPVVAEKNVTKKKDLKKDNIEKAKKNIVVNKTKKEKKDSRFSLKSSVYVGAGYSDYNATDTMSEYIISRSSAIESYNNSNNVKRYSPIIGFDVNLYFRLIKNLQLFAGLDAMTRNLGAATYEYNKVGVLTLSLDRQAYNYLNVTFREYLRLSAKFGARINICKNLAIEPYVLGGINISSINYSTKFSFIFSQYNSGNKTDIGRVFGSGANFILKDRYIIGVEYYNTVNKVNINDRFYQSFKLKVHNIFIKFGIQF